MKGNQTWTITATHQNPLAATTHNGYTRHTTTVTPIVTDNQQNKCLFMCETHKSFSSTTVDPQHLNQTRRSSSIAWRNNWGAKNQQVHMGVPYIVAAISIIPKTSLKHLLDSNSILPNKFFISQLLPWTLTYWKLNGRCFRWAGSLVAKQHLNSCTTWGHWIGSCRFCQLTSITGLWNGFWHSAAC